jgi:hypothetical protein
MLPDMPKNFEGTADYLASQDLRDAVNVAIDLQKPLLIKGEPGRGSFPTSCHLASVSSSPTPGSCACPTRRAVSMSTSIAASTRRCALVEARHAAAPAFT